jgi:hypothetical protein
MKIEKMIFGATIPTGQYANIQPSIEIISDKETDSVSDMKELGMDYIKDLYKKYSSVGELKESEVTSKKV